MPSPGKRGGQSPRGMDFFYVLFSRHAMLSPGALVLVSTFREAAAAESIMPEFEKIV